MATQFVGHNDLVEILIKSIYDKNINPDDDLATQQKEIAMSKCAHRKTRLNYETSTFYGEGPVDIPEITKLNQIKEFKVNTLVQVIENIEISNPKVKISAKSVTLKILCPKGVNPVTIGENPQWNGIDVEWGRASFRERIRILPIIKQYYLQNGNSMSQVVFWFKVGLFIIESINR